MIDGINNKKIAMVDNITVPKSNLRSLLTKKQEKLVDRTDFQTKSLENSLFNYKIYKQKLFLNHPEKVNPKERWVKVCYSGKITFYNLLKEESDKSYWVVFSFTFNKGLVDKKELITFEAHQPHKEQNPQEIAFRRTFKYKFFRRFLSFLTRLHYWASAKTLTPASTPSTVSKKEKLSLWKHS